MRIFPLPHLREFPVCFCHDDTPLICFCCVPVETTAKANGVETEIVNHQEAQDPPTPSGDLSAYLDLSQKLLTVWGSPSEKVLRSDVISNLFASCQKDLRILYGCMSSSPPSEITRKLLTDVSSSRVSLRFVNDCFHTPEAAKVSHLYHVMTKVLFQPCIGVYFPLEFISVVAYFWSNGDIPDMKQ